MAKAKKKTKAEAGMYRADDDDLFRLFDVFEMDHVVECVGGAHDPSPHGDRAGLSQTMGRLLLAPVNKFMARLHVTGRGANALEYDAAQAFRGAIARTMRVLERANLSKSAAARSASALRAAWVEFIAYAGAYRTYDDLPADLMKSQSNSEKQRKRRVGKRKSVTKADLVKSRDAFERDRGYLRGWQKAARLEFDIDQKTLKKRMAE